MNKMKSKKRIKRRGDSFLRDALILCAITLIAGGLMAVVFNMTKIPIKDAKDRAEQTSYQSVFPEGISFEEEDSLNQKQKEFKAKGAEILKTSLVKDKEGNKIGYVFLVESKEGYGGDIEFSVGVKKDGAVTGIAVIQMSETAGLGSKCAEDEFKNQFIGVSGKAELVKGEAKEENEISAISGATITSKAITNAVNQVLAFTAELEG